MQDQSKLIGKLIMIRSTLSHSLLQSGKKWDTNNQDNTHKITRSEQSSSFRRKIPFALLLCAECKKSKYREEEVQTVEQQTP